MIRPAAAAYSREAGVTAEVTRQAAAKERSPAMRSWPAPQADQADGLLADPPRLHGCDNHAVRPGTGGARVTEARSRARVLPYRGNRAGSSAF